VRSTGAPSTETVRAPTRAQAFRKVVYTFTVYALSASPTLPDSRTQVTGAVLAAAIAPVTIGSASLSVSYTRQK